MQRFRFGGFAAVLAAAAVLLVACDGEDAVVSDSRGGEAAGADEQKGAVGEKREGERPNVVWIVLDACRAQNVGCYGYERATTPNIDRLASRGVVFEQHYAQADWTPRSVPSYMTGRYFATSCLDLLSGQQLVRNPPSGERLLPDVLRGNGYTTYLFSGHRAIFVPGARLWEAFDESVDVPKRDAANPLSTQRTLGDLCAGLFARLEQGVPEPFFVYIHAMDTHFPHFLEPPYDRWLDKTYSTEHLKHVNLGQHIRRKDGQPYSEKDQEYILGLYDGSLSYSDAQIGRLMDKLEELGLTERTVVLVGSDHGEALGEDGRTMGHLRAGSSDEVLRVPLVMAGPTVPEGRRVSALTQNVDIVPTLTDLLGLETDAQVDGKSLAPLLRERGGPPVHDAVFAWLGGPTFEEPELFVLGDKAYRYEQSMSSGAEHLWRVPSHLGERTDVFERAPKEAKRLRGLLASDWMPAWRGFLNQPLTGVVLKSAYLAGIAENAAEAVRPACESDESLRSDGKWANGYGWMWSCPWQEDAPALTVRYPVPAGRYRISLSLYSNREHEGRPASSVAVKVEDEEEFRVITRADRAPEEAGFVRVDLGEYDVGDGVFDVVIDEGERGHWACVGAIYLVPVGVEEAAPSAGEEAESADALREQAEAMRAMGYLH